jgi:hypothetical protein
MLLKNTKVKNKILDFFFRYDFTRRFVYFLLKIKYYGRRKKIIQECDFLKQIDLFEYEKLSKCIKGSIEPNEINFYGFDFVLSKYINTSRIKSHITNEHGFIFSSFVSDYYTPKNIVLTFSDYREELLKARYSNNLKIVKIGPFIHYADSILSSEKTKNIKNKLGKTLLVFPFHSIDGVLSSFDTDSFIERIEEYKTKNNFETVMVCLYWKDIQIGRAEEYVQRGYKVTTAGHINDIYFLNRLRTIIELADFVISNEVGTYIGYCLCLKKEIRLINQKSGFVVEQGEENHINSKGFAKIENHLIAYYKLQDKLMEILSSETIELNDFEFVTDLFGLKYLKSKAELEKIINN